MWEDGMAAMMAKHKFKENETYVRELLDQLIVLQKDRACVRNVLSEQWCKEFWNTWGPQSSLDYKECCSPRAPTVTELLLFHTGAPLLVVQCGLLKLELGRYCIRGKNKIVQVNLKCRKDPTPWRRSRVQSLWNGQFKVIIGEQRHWKREKEAQPTNVNRPCKGPLSRQIRQQAPVLCSKKSSTDYII